MSKKQLHPGGIRHRYMADRLMIILLYKPSEAGCLERENGSVLFKPSWLARGLGLNASRVYDQLLYLKELGYLTMEQAPWGMVRLRLAQPLGDDKVPLRPTESYLEKAEAKKQARRAREGTKGTAAQNASHRHLKRFPAAAELAQRTSEENT